MREITDYILLISIITGTLHILYGCNFVLFIIYV